MDEINLDRFIEIIENEGCISKWVHETAGYTIHHYLSANGQTSEQILDDGEPLQREVVEMHLEKLGIYHVVQQLFPPQAEQPIIQETEEEDDRTGTSN